MKTPYHYHDPNFDYESLPEVMPTPPKADYPAYPAYREQISKFMDQILCGDKRELRFHRPERIEASR